MRLLSPSIRPHNRNLTSLVQLVQGRNMSKLIFAPGETQPDTHDQNSSTSDPQSSSNQAAQFKVGTLSVQDLNPDPFAQFHKWFSDPALRGTVPETVTLSTAELPSGRVSSRMVYLKELDDRGWVIYSNWGTSRKAKDIQTNPYASLCFWWKPLERQVRIEGPAERLSSSESQVYYDTRARGSRIGAWASQQTSVLNPQTSSSSTSTSQQQPQNNNDNDTDDGRQELENQVRDVERRFDGVERIPVPEFWGGLRVVPEMVEFWQGRDSRLHDRFRYTKHADSGNGEGWKIERLSP